MKTSEIKTALKPISEYNATEKTVADVKVSGRWITVGDYRFANTVPNFQVLNAGLPVPHDYFQKTPRALVAPLTQHELGQLDAATPVLAIRSSQGELSSFQIGTVVVPTNPIEVVEALASHFNIEDWELYEATFQAFRFLAITDRSAEIRVGDVTKAGFEIVGSVTRGLGLTITLASWRLICSNGMIHVDHGGRYHRPAGNGGGDGSLDDFVKGVGGEAIEGADHIFEELRQADETPVTEETIAGVDQIFKAEKFWGRRAVRRLIEAEPPRTLYDLIQHVSFVATHQVPGRSDRGRFRKRRHNQVLAGALAVRLDVCDSCRQLVTPTAVLPETEVDEDSGDVPGSGDAAVIEGEARDVTPTLRPTDPETSLAVAESEPEAQSEALDEVEAEGVADQEAIEAEATDLVPEPPDILWGNGDAYRIVKIEGGITFLRAGLGKRGRATHQLTEVKTTERSEDAWHVEGVVTKLGKATR